MGHCIEPMDGCIGIDDDAVESIEKFGARELVDDGLVYNAEKCYGCGLCAGTCEAQAITMCEREG